MIVNEKKTIGRTRFNYFYSDRRMKLELDSILYDEIYMPENIECYPMETEIPIEEDSEI